MSLFKRLAAGIAKSTPARGGGIARALPVGRGVPFRGPVRGRPRPPISIGRPVRPMPIDRPVIGRPRPIAIGRPVAPPSGIRPLPIQPPSIGRPTPPISIGGPGGGMITDMRARDRFEQIGGLPVRPQPPISIGGPRGDIDDGGGEVGTGLPIDAPIQRPIRPPQLEPIGSIQQLFQELRPLKKLKNLLPPDTNELPIARPLPVPPPPPKQMEELPFIQQLIPERLGSGPGGNDADRFRRPPPPISIGRPGGGRDDLVFPGGSPTFNERGGILPPEDFDVGFKADRPDPRDFAKQLPGGGTIYDQLADLGEPIPQGPGVAPPPGFLSNIPSGGIQGGINQGVDFGNIADTVGGGGFDRLNPPDAGPVAGLQVVVYGPDGTMYGSPQAAEAAGVTDYSMSPPGSNLSDTFNAGTNVTPQPDLGGAQAAPDPTPPATDPAATTTGTGVTDPTATATGTGATNPAQTQMTQGAIDPVLLNQQASEVIGDPLLRSLYFGTADQPGFFNQLQQAGANLIGSDVPLQQTAGLSPLELLARQQAVAGLGGFEPFFQQNKDLIDQAIGQSRRAEALRDPYFQRAEQQMLLGLGDQLSGIDEARGITLGATDRFGRSLGRIGRQQIGATDQFGRRLSDVEARGEGAADRFGRRLGGIEGGAIGATDVFGRSLGESEDLLRDTLGGYDQGFTQQFYNPFEDAVVQQTIDDVFEAGEQQDVAARAREIGSGAFGGSRARLGAKERREALGEGLAQALGNIRQRGFSEAQRAGLGEFARQQQARRLASQGLSGLAGTRFGAQSGLFDRLTSGAQQRLGAERGVVDLLGRTGQQRFGAQQDLGGTLRGLTGDQFGAQQQLAANLMGYGSAGAGARQNLASGLLGIGQQRGAGAQQLGQSLAGFGQQIGGIGSQLDALRRGQRSELAGFGGVGRGIAETGLSRLFAQQMAQQQRPLNVLGAIAGMLPGYQGSRTQIDSQYGMPTDPTAAGLGAAFSAYGALAPRQGSS